MLRKLNLKSRYDRLKVTLSHTLILRDRVVDATIQRARRAPFQQVDGYVERYWLVRPSRWTLGLGLSVDHLVQGDHDRPMREAPRACLALVLRGSFWDALPARRDEPGTHFGGYLNLHEPFKLRQRKPGDLVLRWRRMRHKVEMFRGTCWLLVIGPACPPLRGDL